MSLQDFQALKKIINYKTNTYTGYKITTLSRWLTSHLSDNNSIISHINNQQSKTQEICHMSIIQE